MLDPGQLLGQKTADDDGNPSSGATLHFVSHLVHRKLEGPKLNLVTWQAVSVIPDLVIWEQGPQMAGI